jgi:small-conductance mechanosensitive channel
MIAPADVDTLSGETVETVTDAAAARLQVALAETAELRAPGRMLRAGGLSLAITAVLAGLLWLLRRLDRLLARRFADLTERRLLGKSAGVTLVASQLVDVCYRALRLLLAATALALVYLWLANVLRRFPYTRPWGESLRALLVTHLSALGATLVDAAPGLFAVALIMVAARWASKAVALLFDAVERGRVSLPGVYPDTAPPTRRLVIAGVWMSALAMAYPYIPGSNTDGVKGMSVFIGVILSFGSAGVIQHLVSGLMLTYARAAHVGDFARIGDVEGTILQIGPIATKMRTPIGEEVTIPNAVVVSQTLTNYSTNGDGPAAYLPTSVTIGYDTPWRQVEALLLAAAGRTTGLRGTPPATVWRVSLDDFYVKYTLLVAPDDPCRRAELLDRLHGHILDAFNEHGVQIMSPRYVTDPRSPKVVPPSQWYAPPAEPAPAPAAKVSARW